MAYSDSWLYAADNILTHYKKLESASDLDPLIERVGDARFVLLSEATHGTHEYYTWRTAISKRLIQEKGFSFIAVEGDWPDCCGHCWFWLLSWLGAGCAAMERRNATHAGSASH